MVSNGRQLECRVPLFKRKSCAVTLALLLLFLPTPAMIPSVHGIAGSDSAHGVGIPRSFGQPQPESVQLGHNFYYYVPFSNPYTSNIVLTFRVTSSVAVDIYVMTQAQFTAFRSSSSTAALYHSFGTNVASSQSLPPSSTSYLVAYNDVSQTTATVQITGSTNPVDVYRLYSGPPAPVGIADYGVENYTGTPLAYEVTSTGVQASAKIFSLRALNSTPPSGVDTDGASLQLNVILGVNTTKGQFAYWLQDVATFRTSVQLIYFQSEIFNESLPFANLSSSLVLGNGQIYPTPKEPPERQNTYIFSTSTANYALPYFNQFSITETNSANSVTVKFGYTVTENGVPVQGSLVNYDTVTITEPNGVTSAGIVVDGYKMNPFNSFYDAEFVFGGEYNGEATTFTQMNSGLSMSYQLAGGGLAQPRSLYEFGSDTAEATYNLQTTYTGGNFNVGIGTTNFHANYILAGGTVMALTLSYSVNGGSPASSSPPVLTFVSGGVTQTAVLTSTPTVYYADNGTKWSVSAQFPNTSTERWVTSSQTSGTATGPIAVSIVYYHQYALVSSYTVAGGGSPGSPTLSYSSTGSGLTLPLLDIAQLVWADAGSGFVATNPLAGSSASERWFSAGNNGTVSSSLTLSLVYNHQYLLTIVSSSTSTVWENAGSQVQLNVQEVFGRSNGVGSRVTAASLDGGAPQAFAPTSGTVPFTFSMNAPHTLTYSLVKQYQVTLQGDAAKALNSITAPTISGDSYWYDSGSQVAALLNGIWGRSSGTGSRLASYSVDGGTAVTATTSGTVSALSLNSIASSHTVTATAVVQYQLSTPSGSISSLSSPAISGDKGWYDAGTSVTIAYDTYWNTVSQQSRLAAKGYSVDSGSTTPVVQGGNGTFGVGVTMNAAHTVDVKFAAQYYVAFDVTDASGTNKLAPSALEISVGGSATQVPGFAIFLDSGANFTISSVSYEGVDVNPNGTSHYSVTGPSTVQLKALVYDARLKVADFLGLPVSGASVKMSLANGSVISGTTAGDGTFTAPEIPLGTFTATVAGLASSARVVGDASTQPVNNVSVFFSTDSLVLLIVAVAALIGISAFALRRRRRVAPPSASRKVSTQLRICPNCGTQVAESEEFCTQCGTRLASSTHT